MAAKQKVVKLKGYQEKKCFETDMLVSMTRAIVIEFWRPYCWDSIIHCISNYIIDDINGSYASVC